MMLRLLSLTALTLTATMFYAPQIHAEEPATAETQAAAAAPAQAAAEAPETAPEAAAKPTEDKAAKVAEEKPEAVEKAPDAAIDAKDGAAEASAAQAAPVDEAPAEQKAAPQSADAPAEAPMPKTAMDPDVRKLNTDLGALTKDLDSARRRHFYTIYNSNNLISTVKYVRGHVGEAIDACSKNNPDMEGALRERYKVWTDVVNENLVSAEGQVNNMVLAQDYAPDTAVRNILKQADALRDKNQKGVERIPVTSKEACDYLLNKMDETQKSMVELLNSVLVAMPQQMQRDDFGDSAAQ